MSEQGKRGQSIGNRSPVRISEEVSARIAATDPGPGLPLSRLPPDVQSKVRLGHKVDLSTIFEKKR